MITLTKRAADRAKILQENQPEGTKLRLCVQEGGCQGIEYGITFAPKAPNDHEMESERIAFLVDKESYEYLQNVTLDIEENEERDFTIINPQATSTCGCGNSFSA